MLPTMQKLRVIYAGILLSNKISNVQRYKPNSIYMVNPTHLSNHVVSKQFGSKEKPIFNGTSWRIHLEQR